MPTISGLVQHRLCSHPDLLQCESDFIVKAFTLVQSSGNLVDVHSNLVELECGSKQYRQLLTLVCGGCGFETLRPEVLSELAP